MPAPNTLRALFVHNDWARVKLLAAAEPLSDEQLDRPFEMGLGSLRKTLHHLWWAEELWLGRWLERADTRPEDPQPRLSVADLRQCFSKTARDRDDFLDRVVEAGESSRISYVNSRGESWSHPLGDMMLHVCNHGFHHRAQARAPCKRHRRRRLGRVQ